MPHFTSEQPLRQLEPRKGGYYYFVVDADVVNQFPNQRSTRLVCTIDQKVSYSCGLNHLGDGNFFVIVATRHVKAIGKNPGDPVVVEICEDPNPLGVEIPEVLQVLLDQDEAAKQTFAGLTDGRKRSLIYAIKNVKDIDKQVQKILAFLNSERVKSR